MPGPKIHKQHSVRGPAVKLLSRDRVPERRLLQLTGLSREKWDAYYRRTQLLKTGNSDSEDLSLISANCHENQPSTSSQTPSKKSRKDSDSICSLISNETKKQLSPDDKLQSSHCQRKDRKLKRKVTFEFYAIPLKKVKRKETRDLFITLFGAEPKIKTLFSISQRNNRSLNSCSNAPTQKKADCCAPILLETLQSSSHDQCKDDSNKGLPSLATANSAKKAPDTEEVSGQLINKENDDNNNAKKCEESEVPVISNSIITVNKHVEDNLGKDLEAPKIASHSNCNDANRKGSDNGTSADSRVTPETQPTIQDDRNEKRTHSQSKNLSLESMKDEAIVSFHGDCFVSWIKEVKLIAHNYFLQCTQQNLKVLRNVKAALLSPSDRKKMIAQIQNHSSICKTLTEIFLSVVNHKNFTLFVICYFLRIYQQIFGKAGELVSLLPDNFRELRFCLRCSLLRSHFVSSITKDLVCVISNLNFEKSCVRVWRVMRESLRGKDCLNVIEKSNEIFNCSSTASKLTVENQTVASAGAQLTSRSNTRLENNGSRGYNAQKNGGLSEISGNTAIGIKEPTTNENTSTSAESSNDDLGNKSKVTPPSRPSATENMPSTIRSGAMKSLGETRLDKTVPEDSFLSSRSSNVSFGVIMKYVQASESKSSAESPNNVRSNENISSKFSPLAVELQKENVPLNTANVVDLESSVVNSNGSVSQARYSSKYVPGNQLQQPSQLLPLHEQNLYEKRDANRQFLQPGNAVFPDASEKIVLAPSALQTAPNPTPRRRRKNQEVPGVAELSNNSNPVNQSGAQYNLNNHAVPPSNYQMKQQTTTFYKTSGPIAPGTHLQNFQVFSQRYSSINSSQNVNLNVTTPIMYTNTVQQSRVVRNQPSSREQVQHETLRVLLSNSQQYHHAQQYHQTQSAQLNTANPLLYHHIQPNPINNQLQPSITRNQEISQAVAVENNWLPSSNSHPGVMLRRASFNAPHDSGFHGTAANNSAEPRISSAPAIQSVSYDINSVTAHPASRKIGNQRRCSVQAMSSSESRLNTTPLTNSVEMDIVQPPVLFATNPVHMGKQNLPSTSSLTLQNIPNISLPRQPQHLTAPAHSSSSNLTSLDRLLQQKLSNMPNTLGTNSKVTGNSQYPPKIPVSRVNSNVASMEEVSVPNIFINQVIMATNNEGQPFSFHVKNVSSEMSPIGTSQPVVTHASGPTHQPAYSAIVTARPAEQPIIAENMPKEGNSNLAVTTGLNTIKRKTRVKYTKRRPPDERWSNARLCVRNKLERNSCDNFRAESPNDNLDKESDSSSSELQIDLDFCEREEETNSIRSQERLNSAADELEKGNATGVLSNADILKLLEGIDSASFSKDFVLELLKKQNNSKNETICSPAEQEISQESRNNTSIPLPPDSDRTSVSNRLVDRSGAPAPVSERSRSEEVVEKSKESRSDENTISATNLVIKHLLPALIVKPRSLSKKDTNNPKSQENTCVKSQENMRVKSQENTCDNEIASQSRNPSKTATDQQQYQILNDPENMLKLVIAAKNADPIATLGKLSQNESTNKPNDSLKEASAATVIDDSDTNTTQNGTIWDSLHSLLKSKSIPEIEDALLDIYLERKDSDENDRALNRETLLNEANEYFKKHTKHEEICQLLDARLVVEQFRPETDEPRKRRILVKEIDAAKKAFIQGEVSRNQVNASPSTTSTSSSQLTPPPTPTQECSRQACSKVIAGFSYSCDGCRTVSYCSEICKNKDFVENHCNECERDDFF